METTTVRRLSHDTAGVLAHVEHGQTVEVTKNGRVVAHIVPVEPDPLAELVAQGLVSLPAPGTTWPPMITRESLAATSTERILDELRGERL
ncbi:type II toxin-antitoxin system Phd/YefM family antitoxin [Cellulomonas hominis]